jgi:hypothetical protein
VSYIRRPKFLSGYEVEWVQSEGEQDPSDFNPDLLVYAHRDFPSKPLALAFAKVKAEQLKPRHGFEVRVTGYHLEHFEAGLYEKEYDSEPTYIEL